MLKLLPAYDTLVSTFQKTVSTAWHINTIHETGLNRWLENFVGDALCSEEIDKERAKELERRLALFLLCNFVYYNEDEVKHLMKVMLERYIHHCLSSKGLWIVAEENIDEIIQKTMFSSLGNQSESSSYMLYLFRQVNELSKRDFEEKKEIESIVFVDDFSITGGQADRYIKNFLRKNPEKQSKKIYVLLMVSTQDAIKKIKEIPEITDVITCITMDESSKTFSDSSIVFQGYSSEIKEQARKMCIYYGESISGNEPGSTPLGFGGGEYLLGAYYNTPNNTIPIFWSEENFWRPIFRRYNKKYVSDSKVRLGGQYV